MRVTMGTNFTYLVEILKVSEEGRRGNSSTLQQDIELLHNVEKKFYQNYFNFFFLDEFTIEVHQVGTKN